MPLREIVAPKTLPGELPLAGFVTTINANPPVRVPGCAVFLTAVEGGTPRALIHNLEHNHVLHQKVVILTARTLNVPVAPDDERLRVEHMSLGIRRVTACYGFQELPDVPGRCATRKPWDSTSTRTARRISCTG